MSFQGYEPFFIPRKSVFEEDEKDVALDALCDRLWAKNAVQVEIPVLGKVVLFVVLF